MTTEDPNIATLRVQLSSLSIAYANRDDSHFDTAFQQVTAAASALASTLAERDRRIAELEETLVASHMAYDRLEARLAPPAPAPGELAEQHEKLWALIRAYRAESAGDLVGVAGAIGRIVDPLFENAAKWQQLQWRPASEAPVTNATHIDSGDLPDPVLVNAGAIYIGSKSHDGRWFDVYGEELSGVLGWLPLDALPALNGGDE